jgi:membrane-bound lytic murein transglycosylase F
MRLPRSSASRSLAALAVALGLSACEPEPPAKLLDTIRARGELRVATLNGPTAYYIGAHGPQGLEFALSRGFARELQVGLFIYPVADETALREELESGRADLAAAQLSFHEGWKSIAAPAIPYDHVAQVAVYRRGTTRPAGLASLERLRVVVEADSDQLRMLQRLRHDRLPELRWQETAGRAVEGPLALVTNGKADVAVVDANELAFIRPLYPALGVAFTFPDKRPVQWLVRREGADLRAAADGYLRSIEGSGELARLLRQAAADTRRIRPTATRELPVHIVERLPRLQPLFEQASIDTGLDWRLIAAVAYQESQWDPRAESPNGAQGVMMLMSATAASLGVKDVWNARENILAGARYLKQMREKIPARIVEPDRTWLALAAYNVGYGHLEDARVLAQKRGKSPDRWADVRAHLPLLAEEAWYSHVKRGYARGWEPVQFVDRIQQFLNVLEWRHAAEVALGTATAPAS